MTNAVALAQSGSNNVTMRNRIINGAMVISQRGTSFAPAASAVFTMDRWATYASTGTIAVTQSTDAPAGFSNSFLWTTTTGGSRNAGDYYEFYQFIEGYNTADLSWGTSSAKPITISFWTKSSVTGVFGILFRNSAGNRNYVTTYTINSANTWEQKSITLAGCTDGTWLTTNGAGIQVWFDLGSGSSYQTSTLNSWISNSGTSLTSTTQAAVGSVTGATYQITGVQLEAGTTASPFEYRQYGTELALCQRYYQTYGIGNGVGTNTQRCISATNNSGNLIGTWSFIQNMRAAPSATVYGSGTTTGNLVVNYSASGQAIAANTAVTFSSLSVNGWMFNMGSTITANITNWIDMGTATNAGAFTFSAEL